MVKVLLNTMRNALIKLFVLVALSVVGFAKLLAARYYAWDILISPLILIFFGLPWDFVGVLPFLYVYIVIGVCFYRQLMIITNSVIERIPDPHNNTWVIAFGFAFIIACLIVVVIFLMACAVVAHMYFELLELIHKNWSGYY